MDPEIHFSLLAFELLGWGDILPCPLMDGHEGDPYLTDLDYGRLCMLVCGRVPGLTAGDWNAASLGERIAYMEAAIAAADGSPRLPVECVDGSPRLPVECVDGTLPNGTNFWSEGTPFNEDDVPAAFRDGGKPDGAVLTSPYLESNPNWDLKGPHLTKHYGPGKELTTHVKVGRAKAYLYTELLVLRDRKTASQSDREERQPKRR